MNNGCYNGFSHRLTLKSVYGGPEKLQDLDKMWTRHGQRHIQMPAQDLVPGLVISPLPIDCGLLTFILPLSKYLR